MWDARSDARAWLFVSWCCEVGPIASWAECGVPEWAEGVVPRFVCLCAPVTGSCDFFL